MTCYVCLEKTRYHLIMHHPPAIMTEVECDLIPVDPFRLDNLDSNAWSVRFR